MPANLEPTVAQPPSTNDVRFRRIMVISTALSMAAAYGWLAGFARQPDGDLAFQWRWLILLWALIGFATTVYFWRKAWPLPGQPEATRKDIVQSSVVVILPGLWWLALPLRSLSGQHAHQVIEGLIAAAIVLSFGAFMVIRLGKGFEEEDSVNSEIKSSDPVPADNDADLKK
jgi:hypothetical protein